MGGKRAAPEGGRRDFLRNIARDGVNSASSLLGAVGAIREEADALATELRGTTKKAGLTPGGVQPPRRRGAESALALPFGAGLTAEQSERPDPAFASPIRDDAGAIVVLDVRALPAQIIERRVTSAGALAALVAVEAIAPGPIRALAAGFALAVAADGTPGARAARLHAAAGALRNADPLSDALAVEIDLFLAAAEGHAALVTTRAVARLAAYATAADTIAQALAHRNGAVATGPALGATAWGDLAPAHEGVRRAGATELLIATGATCDPIGATRLGALDASDALRAGLAPELLDEGALAARILAGEVGALLLALTARASDGAALLPAGGAALAAVAQTAGIPVIGVATPMRTEAPVDAAALQALLNEHATATSTSSLLERGTARGVTVSSPRFDLVDTRSMKIIVVE